MRITENWIALILIVLLAIGSIPVSVFAAEGTVYYAGVETMMLAGEAEERRTSENAVKEFVAAAKRVPAASEIKENQRKLVTAADRLYKKLTGDEKRLPEVRAAYKTVKTSRKALNKPTIVFGNKAVTKALNKNGTGTKYIEACVGDTLKLKAKPSTGAGVVYALKTKNGAVKVSSRGVITAGKVGKAVVLVKCMNTTVEVRVRVTEAFDGQNKKEIY